MELAQSTPVDGKSGIGNEYKLVKKQSSSNLKEKMDWYVNFIMDNLNIEKKEATSVSQSLAQIETNVTEAEKNLDNNIETARNPYLNLKITDLRKWVENDKEFKQPLYDILLKFPDSSDNWTVKRNYKDFKELSSILSTYKELGELPEENKAGSSELDNTLTKLVEWLKKAWLQTTSHVKK